MSPEEGRTLMLSSKTEREWDENCDKVLQACGRRYPGWWYETIVLPGIHLEAQKLHGWRDSHR